MGRRWRKRLCSNCNSGLNVILISCVLCWRSSAQDALEDSGICDRGPVAIYMLVHRSVILTQQIWQGSHTNIVQGWNFMLQILNPRQGASYQAAKRNFHSSIGEWFVHMILAAETSEVTDLLLWWSIVDHQRQNAVPLLSTSETYKKTDQLLSIINSQLLPLNVHNVCLPIMMCGYQYWIRHKRETQ